MVQDHNAGITPNRLQTKVSDLVKMRLGEKLAATGSTESQYIRSLLIADLIPKE
jgi:hypothetical protein